MTDYEHSWRRPELDAISDREFVEMPMLRAEELCAIQVGNVVEPDEGGLRHLRYLNELRRRLARLANSVAVRPTP